MMPMMQQGMQPGNPQALIQRLMQMRQQGGNTGAPLPNAPAPMTPGNAPPMAATQPQMNSGMPPVQPQPNPMGGGNMMQSMGPQDPMLARKLMMLRQQQQPGMMPGAAAGVNGMTR